MHFLHFGEEASSQILTQETELVCELEIAGGTPCISCSSIQLPRESSLSIGSSIVASIHLHDSFGNRLACDGYEVGAILAATTYVLPHDSDCIVNLSTLTKAGDYSLRMNVRGEQLEVGFMISTRLKMSTCNAPSPTLRTHARTRTRRRVVSNYCHHMCLVQTSRKLPGQVWVCT